MILKVRYFNETQLIVVTEDYPMPREGDRILINGNREHVQHVMWEPSRPPREDEMTSYRPVIILA